MSSANGTATRSSTQPNGHKKNNSSHSKVAIPLALSKTKKRPAVQQDDGSKEQDVADPLNQGDLTLSNAIVPSDDLPVAKQVEDTDDKKENETSDASASASIDHASSSSSADISHAHTPITNDSMTAPSTDASSTARKPAQIRTQLPPAFIPSSASPTFQQNFSPNGHYQRNSQSLVHNAAHMRSFGNGESASNYNGSVQHSSRRPPQSPTSFGPASHHTHQYSDSNASLQGMYAPSSANWRPQQNQHFQHQHSSPAFRYPPRESFSYPNGANGAHHFDSSQAPPPISTDVKSPHDPRTQFSQPQYSPMHSEPRSATFPVPSPDSRSNTENAQALAQHVASFYTTPTFSDMNLRVVLERDGASVVIPSHKIILSRSPTLHSIINSTSQDSTFTITAPGEWITLAAFNEAIECLYGAQPQRLQSVQSKHGAEQFRHVLACIAAGQWLRIPAISHRACDIAASILSWDVAILALNFALEGGLSENWARPGPPQVYSNESNGRVNGPINDPAATQLLHAVLSFMTTTFPPNFYPDTAAAQLQDVHRFPSELADVLSSSNEETASRTSTFAHRTSRSINDPRLSRIRFGDLAASSPVTNGNSRPSPLGTVISSILLSLPFEVLKPFLEHPALSDRLGVETVASITRQIILERESRRAKALEAWRQLDSEQASTRTATLVDNLFLEETVDNDVRSHTGSQLIRRRIAQS